MAAPGSDASEALPHQLQPIVRASPSLLPLLNRLVPIARSRAPVLIAGETGTGKELMAHAVHYLSPRASRPWVPVNCGGLPAELVESEFFGHVRGAFTGATQARNGLVNEAHGGTLFLDEVDSMPLQMQGSLLRFLQDQQFRPVGADRSQNVDVRIVAACNCNLETLVQRGRFRRDLYYRLQVLTLDLPPLRARLTDIRPLVLHFVEAVCAGYAVVPVALTEHAWRALHAHDWPGNVRELEHVIERAVLLCRDHVIDAPDLNLPVADTTSAGASPDPVRRAQEVALSAESFKAAKQRLIDEFECHYLDQLLLLHHGNVSRAAVAARKNRRALSELLRKHAIDPERYR